MATRQYVGARYVPKFATPIEWDGSRAYEALEIVTNLGSSYTSKKPVPANTAITNTEYWVLTGNYNGQVEQYRQEVNELLDDVSVLTDEHYIIVGDSYSVNREGQTGWSTYLVNYLGLTEYNGNNASVANCWRACEGSLGFVGLPTTGGTLSWLSYIQENYPADYDKNKVTKIIIAGGSNDRSYTTVAIAAAIRTFDDYVKLNFPNAKVYLFCCGASLDDGTWNSNMWAVYTAYCRAAEIAGWSYCSGLEAFYYRVGYMLSDYHHPVSGANAEAARIIKNVLTNGTIQPVEGRSPITAVDGVTIYSGLSLYSRPVGVECEAYFPIAGVVEFATDTTFGSNVQIGTLSGSFYATFGDRGASFATIAVDANNAEKPINLKLIVDKDGNVYVRRAGNVSYSANYRKILIPSGVVLRKPVFLGG